MNRAEFYNQWQKCLSLIREKLDNERAYNTWFADIYIEHYNSKEKIVTLVLPNKYVYEYLEQHCLKLLGWALTSTFGEGIKLSYRIIKQPAFADVAAYLHQYGYDPEKDSCNISIANAKKRMEEGLKYFLKDKPVQWLPEYDKVAEWLNDNKGRGLLVVGAPGIGKTLICKHILPVILGNGGRKIASVNASELHDKLEELKHERIVIIDDLGKEPRKNYGNIDNSFYELCSHAEQTHALLIITTNLSTTPVPKEHPDAALYPDSIQNRYGNEVLDRLKAITKVAIFKGKSMRA